MSSWDHWMEDFGHWRLKPSAFTFWDRRMLRRANEFSHVVQAKVGHLGIHQSIAHARQGRQTRVDQVTASHAGRKLVLKAVQ